MKNTNKIQGVIAAIILFGIVTTPSFAGKIVLSGSIACPATNFDRKHVTELHDRVYGLRNFDNNSTATITRIRAWNNDGDNTYDGLPNSVGGFKSILNPNESARFRASDVLPKELPPYNIQQIRIDYVLDKPGMALHVGFAHFTTNILSGGYQTARHGGVCINIPPSAQ